VSLQRGSSSLSEPRGAERGSSVRSRAIVEVIESSTRTSTVQARTAPGRVVLDEHRLAALGAVGRFNTAIAGHNLDAAGLELYTTEKTPT
jgi:hypothetical protein